MGTRTLDRRRLDSPHRDPLLERFGDAARRERERRGMSRETVAARGGLSAVYLGNIERGEVNPTLLTQHRLATGLGIALDALIAMATHDGDADGAGAVSAAPAATGGASAGTRRPASIRRSRRWPA